MVSKVKTTKIKLKEWKSMKLIRIPTATSGTVRRDSNGNMWEYVFNTARNCHVRQVHSAAMASLFNE